MDWMSLMGLMRQMNLMRQISSDGLDELCEAVES